MERLWGKRESCLAKVTNDYAAVRVFLLAFEVTPLSTNPPKLTIVVKSGPQSGQCFVVPFGGALSVGRTNAADVAIEDDHFMSGKHFEVQNCGDYAEIRDFKSTNKTWVNNVAIATAKLQSGDTFRAGKTVFSLEWEKPVPLPDEKPDTAPVMAEVPSLSTNNDFQSPILSVFEAPIVLTKPIPEDYRRNAESDESHRNSSPIESIDETYDEADDAGKNTSNVPIHTPRNFESFGSPLIDENELSGESLPQSRQLIRLESQSPASFWSVISKLSERHSTKIVGHFKKIGMLVPNSLTVEPVFQELSECKSWMPVVVEGKEWLRRDMASITERLAKTDGIMLMVGLNSSAFQVQLQALSQRSVPGFSEAGGFLGWCWPSQWHAIGQRLSDVELRALMGTAIQGAIYPWCGSNWAHIVPELSHEMHDLGFV